MSSDPRPDRRLSAEHDQDEMATLPWWAALAGALAFAGFAIGVVWLFAILAWLLRLG
jgi:hypothetical protein